MKSNPVAVKMLGPAARLINRLGGNFRWQHLPVPFEVYADGIDLVIFEEFGAGAAALHLRDEVERDELLKDEAYRRRFRKEYESKFGLRVWHRDFFDAERAGRPFMSIEHAVHRLTGELADWYRIDAGHLRVGDRADVVVIDPEHLDEVLDRYAEEEVAQYGGLSRMVNRNDDTVAAVFVGAGRCSSMVSSPNSSERGAPDASCAPLTRRRPWARRKVCWPMSVDEVRDVTPAQETVYGIWRALSARDWEALKTYLAPDCIYLDMPVGPAAAARGPDDIVKRLKIGLEPLASYQNFGGLMVGDGADVMYEHHEEWHWPTGESAVLQFVTVPCTACRTAKSRCGRTTGTWGRWPTMHHPRGWPTSPRRTCRGCSTRPASSEQHA